MKIDICIPVYKPDDKLSEIIKRLNRQTVKPNKYIIMYTKMSDDDHLSSDIIDEGNRVAPVVVHEISADEFDHGRTRFQAVSCSDAEIFVCMTQDAIPKDNLLLEHLLKAFNNPKVAAAYARQLPSKNSSLSECFTRQFNYPDKSCVKYESDIETMGIKAFFCSDVCAAYRRSAYEQAGGFIRRGIFNEDMILARRLLSLGYGINYVATAGVIHTHEYTAMQQLHRNFDLGVSQKMNSDVFDGISSESEGVKYVKCAYSYFKDNHRGYLIVPFVYGCCFKYLGYFLGKRYDKLPKWLVNRLAMNKRFFKNI